MGKLLLSRIIAGFIRPLAQQSPGIGGTANAREDHRYDRHPDGGGRGSPIKGKISREWVVDFTRMHEQWDYDSVLVGYYASAAEGFGVALYAADHTERIKFLIAHRPGSVAPALAARQVATFDQLTQGRMSLHIIAGTTDQDQASEGDFLPKNDRYRRAGEYLNVMRRMWTSETPFDHHGEFYRVEGAYSDIKP